ncbi:C-glycoside deglycosidase beta subunit domain-containing protein [Anaerocolumna jejuensis]|uniref:C-glycoside deglycosidase beta subunit domain-containing protein n=1 Tax=Anaerocolumna jejuensis TaxID=259063 RepID=UPI003F7B59EC
MGLVMKLSFTDIIREGTFRNYYVNGKVLGYQFDIRLGYYRGHYLSAIDELAVEVDGKKIDSNDVFFGINNKEFGTAELKYLFTEFWNILTPATIRVHKMDGLCPGEHDINLKLMLRSPYMPLPGSAEYHTYTPIDSSDRKTFVLKD